jgi:phage tail-like protein
MGIATYDPLRSFKFHVILDGWGAAGELGFQKVSGLKESSDVVEYREGNMMVHKRKLPGLTNYEPVTLTRGAGPGQIAQLLFSWRAQTARFIPGGSRAKAPAGLSPLGDGIPEGELGPTDGSFRRSVGIKVFDKGEPNQEAVREWKLNLAWPSELAVSDLNAEASEVLIDTLVLQHEGLEIVAPTYTNPPGARQ